ncbi:hypothetical protein Tco_0841095 [Tanacetum coccineum]|uniref:Uncharacterized protein n=1 Tax=Tanacetum coccineum TaxID=301880 RepID=A0ABQ5AZA6_9ASTR
MLTLHSTRWLDDVPSFPAQRPPFRARMGSSPNCTLKPSNSFEWHKTIFEMVTSMEIRHTKVPNPLRLSKTWQSLKHPKNSSIPSKPDRAHICKIIYHVGNSLRCLGQTSEVNKARGVKVAPLPDYIPGPEVPPSPNYMEGWLADYPADNGMMIMMEDEDEATEEEEEHPAPADSVPPVHRMTARISIRDEPSISLPPREEVERLLALTTPPPSPLTPLSSPLPQIPSSPLPIPSPPPNSPTHIEIPESYLPLRKRVRFASPTPSHEVGKSSAADAARQDGPAVAREDPYSIARGDLYGFVDMVDVALGHPMSRELNYGITDTWDDLVGAIEEIAPTTLEGVNQRVTNLSTTVEQETTIMYDMMEDAQDDRSLLRARVNLLYRDRPVHCRLAVMIEREAMMAREAWGLSMDASDHARLDVMSLHTTVMAQSALISELQSADHKRQGVIKELCASDHKRQVQLTKALQLLKGLQTQMTEFHRQHGPTKGSAHPDAPGEAGSTS